MEKGRRRHPGRHGLKDPGALRLPGLRWLASRLFDRLIEVTDDLVFDHPISSLNDLNLCALVTSRRRVAEIVFNVIVECGPGDVVRKRAVRNVDFVANPTAIQKSLLKAICC